MVGHWGESVHDVCAIHVADMDEAYDTCSSDDENCVNHDYNDDTGDGSAQNNDSSTAAGDVPFVVAEVPKQPCAASSSFFLMP